MNYLSKRMLMALCLVLNGWISAGAQDIYNWRNASGEVWTSSSGECWRSLDWTPSTAAPLCDGALAPKLPVVVPAEPVTPKAVPIDIEKPVVVVPPPVVPLQEKVVYKTVTLFDFDKADITPEARLQLDDVVLRAKSMNLEVVIVVGHADATGPESYNLDLSLRRALAVKSYLVSKGLDKNKIFTEGKGESQPVVDNRTRQNRAKNRRVEIEVSGKSMK